MLVPKFTNIELKVFAPSYTVCSNLHVDLTGAASIHWHWHLNGAVA